jgi:putative inorganic carbon (hco3(-)) transporter
LPFVWYLYKASKSTIPKAIAFGILCLGVITIIVTFSRGGFLTLLGLILWLGLIKFKENRARVILGGVLCLMVFMVFTPEGYSNRIISIVDTKQDKTGSADVRWESMKMAAQIAVEHPLGTGLNMNNLAIQEAGFGWAGVHNVYLEIACDLGLLAGFLFIRLLWKLLVGMRHIRLSSGERNVGALAEATEGSLVAFAVAAMFHAVSYHFYFYYLAGIAVAVNEMVKRSGLNAERAK